MSDLKTLLSKLPASIALSSDLHSARVPGCRRVWYCTNRKVQDPTSLISAKRLSGERGSCEYGLCQVEVDPGRPLGQSTEVVVNVPFFRREEKTVKTRSPQQLSSLEMFLKLSQQHQGRQSRSSLLFVHGYHVGFDAAIERAAQLAEDLRISGEAFAFSWPSQDALVDYVADQDRAERSVEDLAEWVKFIIAAVANWGEHPLHVVAHSMGNRLLAPALAKILPGLNPAWRLGEVLLAAADADVDRMEDWLGSVVPHARRVSVYASATDRALGFSQRLHKSPRFGAKPSENELWDVVHCDGAGEDWIQHSYLFETPAVLRDMQDVLHGMDCCERHLVSAGEKRAWKLVAPITPH